MTKLLKDKKLTINSLTREIKELHERNSTLSNSCDNYRKLYDQQIQALTKLKNQYDILEKETIVLRATVQQGLRLLKVGP